MNYNYTKDINVERLTKEINDSDITISLSNITCLGNNVDITFKAELSQSEKTTLDTIIENQHNFIDQKRFVE